MIKILIGTPIHVTKDYAMEKWLKNVADLIKKTPADLLLVDNSPGLDYVEKVKGYCKNYGIKNYKITHFEYDQGMGVYEIERRVEVAQEIIRKEILSNDYDAWFSWECDLIIPNSALDKLVKLAGVKNIMMVVHNTWLRNNPEENNPDMGITLIKRECLEKDGVLLERGSGNWEDKDSWYKKRVLRDRGNYVEVFGLISPIYHLNE